MRQWLRSHVTYANVMVTILAFIVLGGGTALASYVVSSNGQVGPNTISGHAPPSGKHANVIPGSVDGQDVADNSLRGADVLESSLGQVRSAKLGGLGADTAIPGNNCNPESAQFITCVQTRTINLAAPTRVLIIGQVDAVSDQPGVKGQGDCHVGSNVGFLPESTTTMFVKDQNDAATMSGVTGVLGPGPIKFGLDCNEVSGNGIGYLFPHISFVELSSGSP
jgi:hypothetical protein